MAKPDADIFRIKAAMADLIERCGGQKRSGGLVSLSQQMMSCICDRKHSAMLSLRAKLLLEMECGAPLVTAVEAELLGYRLEPVAPRTANADGTPYDAHAAVMTEVADLCRSFSVSVADGRYSHTDALTVGRDLAELRRSIERFERVNAATLAGGGA